MSGQLDLFPCGYLKMDKRFHVTDINRRLLDMIGVDASPSHIHDMLTVASRVYFQTYFTPSILTHGKVNEMYLTLKGVDKQIPVLLNAVEQDGGYACVIVQMSIRDEYESELLSSKRNAERILQETDEAYKRLQSLMNAVEEKQQELIKLNFELQDKAMTDPLTGLKNRRYLQEKLQEYIDRATTQQSVFSLLLIDVDHFKRVNDTYGHESGDSVLQELSWKLEKETREQDIVARLGGEEFVVVLPNTNKDNARVIAERIRLNILHGSWSNARVSISIGVSTYEPGDVPPNLFMKADEALYRSKKDGRNRVSVH